MKLYEFAVIMDERTDADGEVVEMARIIVKPTTVLARDDAQAQLLAARSIAADDVKGERLDRIRVVVRPF